MAKKKSKRTTAQQADPEVDTTSLPSKQPRYNTRSSMAKASTTPNIETSEATASTLTTSSKAKKRRTTTASLESPATASSAPVTTVPKHNTRFQKAKASTAALEDDDEDDDASSTTSDASPQWPRYKDDMLNAFNGEVDASKDYIRRLPAETLENILSYLVLDHDPERGVKKASGGPAHTHVLISLAAMSRTFYFATESFCALYLRKHQKQLWWTLPEQVEESHRQQEANRRRSARLQSKQVAPSPESTIVHRYALARKLSYHCGFCYKVTTAASMHASTNAVCWDCEHEQFGPQLNLSEALRRYDLRDYMLLKSRKPGPRAKNLDLPELSYGSDFKGIGFPVFKTVLFFSFDVADVKKIARLVHGDYEYHMERKAREREDRAVKARCRRVKEVKVKHHEILLEATIGRAARRHMLKIEQLLELPDHKDGSTRCPCCDLYIPDDEDDYGLCIVCGDVPGRPNPRDCDECLEVWMDDRYDQYFANVGR